MAVTLTDVAGRFRELIAALDRRSPRVDRAAEAAIATVFPASPGDVAKLTVQEFTFDLDDVDGNPAPSMERVCRTFMDDTNRALVWWIRFEALKAWYSSTDPVARTFESPTLRDAREAAATFPLNHRWEFDSEDFCSAIDAVAVKRARADAD